MRYVADRCVACRTPVRPAKAIGHPETPFWFCSQGHYDDEAEKYVPKRYQPEHFYKDPEYLPLVEPWLDESVYYDEEAVEKVIHDFAVKWYPQRQQAWDAAREKLWTRLIAEHHKQLEEEAEKQREREAREMQRQQDRQEREAERLRRDQEREMERQRREQERNEERAAKEREKFEREEQKQRELEAEELKWKARIWAKPPNEETRFSGTWICGAQGSGKTELLKFMIARDLAKWGKNASIVILDCKGDLSRPLSVMNLGERLVVLRPHNPFAINPLDVPKTDIRRAVNQLEYIFGALLEASVTPKQKALLRTVLRALLTGFPEPTLHTIQDLITNGPDKYWQYINQLPPDLQEFFKNEWDSYKETRGELKWRMRLVLENELIQKMFGAPRTRFKIAEAMDRGDVIIIDNAIQHLHEDGSAFLGRFFLAQIWSAAMQRQSTPRDKRRPVFVYCDEAHRIIDSNVANIIDMCRSANIAIILAHQRTKQIQDPNVLSALENCATKIVNVDAEAEYFSSLLHIPVERINQLPVGRFAMHVRGEGSSIIQIPMVDFSRRKMTQDQLSDQWCDMRRMYGIEKTHNAPRGVIASIPIHGTTELPREPETHEPKVREVSRKAASDKKNMPPDNPSQPTRWIRKKV